jgi:chorismate mutase
LAGDAGLLVGFVEERSQLESSIAKAKAKIAKITDWIREARPIDAHRPSLIALTPDDWAATSIIVPVMEAIHLTKMRYSRETSLLAHPLALSSQGFFKQHKRIGA